jgi:hypothetical protein
MLSKYWRGLLRKILTKPLGGIEEKVPEVAAISLRYIGRLLMEKLMLQ